MMTFWGSIARRIYVRPPFAVDTTRKYCTLHLARLGVEPRSRIHHNRTTSGRHSWNISDATLDQQRTKKKYIYINNTIKENEEETKNISIMMLIFFYQNHFMKKKLETMEKYQPYPVL